MDRCGVVDRSTDAVVVERAQHVVSVGHPDHVQVPDVLVAGNDQGSADPWRPVSISSYLRAAARRASFHLARCLSLVSSTSACNESSLELNPTSGCSYLTVLP